MKLKRSRGKWIRERSLKEYLEVREPERACLSPKTEEVEDRDEFKKREKRKSKRE